MTSGLVADFPLQVSSYWFSEKTKPKVGYHFRKILKLKVDRFQKIVGKVH